MKRRTFLKTMGCAALVANMDLAHAIRAKELPFRMPEEGEPHAATWMAFGATEQAWGKTGSYGRTRLRARQDLMNIAVALSAFEPINMLVSPNDQAQAEHILSLALKQQGIKSSIHPIQLISQAVDDLWMRDTGAVFVVYHANQLRGIDFHFNGWGQENTSAAGWKRDPDKAKNGIERQPINNDQKVADFILQQTQTLKLDTWLVLEGGGIEVDGKGTAICTESCILNDNRNPNRSKAEAEAELLRIMGIRKVIWLPGLKAYDITDGHTDFYARFVDNGAVVYGLDNDPDSAEYELTHTHEAILKAATNAQGQPLELTALIAPNSANVKQTVMTRNNWTERDFNGDTFAAGYVGFYVANGCVLMQQFGDAQADTQAFDVLQKMYPNRKVIQIATDGLANGGGTIHCATQQQPALMEIK